MDADDDRALRAVSFGAAAQAYQRARPTYPDAAVHWLLPSGAQRVLDLGAGTGKLTAALTARGLDVIAVDPSPAMLEQLRVAVPGVRALAGAAEAIPLPDASVDAVLLADAWQWVDPARAIPEIARVLRPGGRLALVWNLRDDALGWSARLRELLDEHTHHGITSTPLDLDDPGVGETFAPLERYEVPWTQHLTREQVLDVVASRSDVITLAQPHRQHLLQLVRERLATHPDLSGAPDVAMDYTARCYRTHLP